MSAKSPTTNLTASPARPEGRGPSGLQLACFLLLACFCLPAMAAAGWSPGSDDVELIVGLRAAPKGALLATEERLSRRLTDLAPRWRPAFPTVGSGLERSGQGASGTAAGPL
jgi:hypothetical protein